MLLYPALSPAAIGDRKLKTSFSQPPGSTAGPRNDYGRIRVDRCNRQETTPQTYLDRFAATMESVFLSAFRAAEKGGCL